jgi:hypothetical protein
MPEIQEICNQDSFLNTNWIYAYMLYPDDESERKSLMAVSVYNTIVELSGKDKNIEISMETLNALLTAPSINQLNIDQTKLTKQACLAGYIALHLIEMDISGIEASLEKAKYLTERAMNTAIDAYGKKKSTSDSSNKRAWNAFKSVSHFWAANLIFTDMYGHEKARKIMLENPLSFYSMAKEISILLTQLKPNSHSNNNLAFSIENLWTIPDILELPNPPFKSSGLSEFKKRQLEEGFKATKF